MSKYLNSLVAIFISLMIISNFYVFSRFTVDDAFISWRYGANFINHDVWGYNPTNFDLTQAYTNPLFAYLSIFPAYFNIDVVVFFKLASVFTAVILTVAFFFLCQRKINSLLLLGTFYCIPATVIHLFSGLETFLFGFLLGLFFILIDQNKNFRASLLLALLCIIRPEAWLLAVLFGILVTYCLYQNKSTWRSCGIDVLGLLIIAVLLLSHFATHYLYFGDFLPNTFYVKNSTDFNAMTFLKFAFILIPLVFVSQGYKKSTNFMILIFMFFLIFQYSNSNLAMNYASRFGYHFAIPTVLLVIYVISKDKSELKQFRIVKLMVDRAKVISYTSLLVIAYAALIFVTSYLSSRPDTLFRMANYYPRLLFAHAELGEALRQSSKGFGFDTYSFGDAGLVAFNSNLINLDTVGLASKMVAQSGGVTNEIVDAYSPSVVVFYGDEDGAIARWPKQHAQLRDYIKINNFMELCSVYFRPGDLLTIYSINNADHSFEKACSNSRSFNNVSEIEFLSTHIFTPPWEYWRVNSTSY